MSKNYSYSDLPKNVSKEAYEESQKRFIDSVAGIPGLVSIYGFGSVGHPGISDIDLLLVFQDDSSCTIDFRGRMSDQDKYLFIHAPYATNCSLLLEGQHFTFFRPYRLLKGDDILYGKNFREADPLVRHQVALEYLLRLYFSLSMQNAYRLLRVRSTLLNAKGAFIDIKHLEPSDLDALRFSDHLSQLRSTWFSSKRPPLKEFSSWFDGFFAWFTVFLQEQLRTIGLYLPEDKIFQVARNLTFSKGASLKIDAKVIRMPLLKPVMGRKYFNLLNRFSRFHATVPFEVKNIPAPLSAYFDYNNRHRNHNRLHLPNTLPLTNSLHLR